MVIIANDNNNFFILSPLRSFYFVGAIFMPIQTPTAVVIMGRKYSTSLSFPIIAPVATKLAEIIIKVKFPIRTNRSIVITLLYIDTSFE